MRKGCGELTASGGKMSPISYLMDERYPRVVVPIAASKSPLIAPPVSISPITWQSASATRLSLDSKAKLLRVRFRLLLDTARRGG
jgi:hypothetical protein